ncbi:DUF4132 domain-containing protein [Catenulispora sp. GP43]|uniref:DUF4132 domain-containing protein n=1 Tax=Catenulispora sp. GP43 TaxID=3156263 RepID=UPI0035160830
MSASSGREPRLGIEEAVPFPVDLLKPVAAPKPVAVPNWDQDEALRHILGQAADAPAVRQVLDLCDTLHGLMPPAPWREQMASLLADNAAGVGALRAIALRETPFDDPRADHRVPFVRSVVWALGLTEPADAVPLLIRITELYGEPGRGREYRSVAVTAVEALGGIGGERALPALRRIRAEAKLGDVRRAASRELDRTLDEAHLSRADVPEWQAETFDLDRDGLRVIELGHGYTATIQLDADGTVTLFYVHPTGQRLSTQPSGVRAEDLHDAASVAASLRTVVYAERFRLKQLMKDQRTLTYEDWMESYLGNPVTGRLCRALVWESSIDGGEHWRRFLPVWSARREAWLRLGEDGVSHEVSEESQARVVDPQRFTAAEKRAWAVRLRKLKLTQPFEQVGMPRG